MFVSEKLTLPKALWFRVSVLLLGFSRAKCLGTEHETPCQSGKACYRDLANAIVPCPCSGNGAPTSLYWSLNLNRVCRVNEVHVVSIAT